jgi:glycosyltransferase involved in cell wall biosynthesis
MRILIVLTYFYPHKSGLTVYAIRQAQALAALGHEVIVLTSQYDPSLPKEEWNQGVRILRLPVAFHLSKGVIMPRMPFEAYRLIGESDVVNLHVPQVDAALVALLAKLRRKPVVLTYHCDLIMPEGMINQLAGWAAGFANRISAGLADMIVHNTRDFAEHSDFLQKYLDKLTVIAPPIEVEPVTQADVDRFYATYDLQPGHPVIGMVARLATEKGVEFLVEAMMEVVKVQPQVRAVFVGEYQNVFGEEAYREKLLPMIESLGDRWTFLGVVSEIEKAVFYQICDVLVLPSINSTESFGMVQVEALTCGTPVIATDLPGVRQPVLTSGMGEIIPVRDAEALAKALIRVLSNDQWDDPDQIAEIKQLYAPETTARQYEALFHNLVGEHGEGHGDE